MRTLAALLLATLLAPPALAAEANATITAPTVGCLEPQVQRGCRVLRLDTRVVAKGELRGFVCVDLGPDPCFWVHPANIKRD